jgi:hypothetical protein
LPNSTGQNNTLGGKGAQKGGDAKGAGNKSLAVNDPKKPAENEKRLAEVAKSIQSP